MPLPPPPYVFDAGLKYFSSPGGSLDTLVRQQLEFAARDVGMMSSHPPVSDSGDLVTELGEYLTQTATLWAQLTEQLVHGPHIAQTTIKAHERSRAMSHLSDLAEVARIDVNVAKLRQIRNLSLRFSQEVQQIWRPELILMRRHPMLQTSIQPWCEAKFSQMAEGAYFVSDSDPLHAPSRGLLAGKSQMNYNPNINGDVSGSDCSSSDDDEQFQSIDMDALRQRGKGVYFCPKGVKCDKGGVDKDGNLVVFDRNSSFAIATNTANLGAATYLAARILRRKDDSLDATG
ncbi:hypothetical protein E4U42_004430 [Claviceps africana]|uniref:Uncharacterized protein n=1 Tax=Claviceps africana TaxID=83212 RepID=A0A8K0NKT7_9HYPO|nr:hypothetical protein E4U42_004430 [Claviceps africana]